MGKYFEKYILYPIEREITDADAKVELICSKDHPIMDFFYESAFYRHDCKICDTIYALPYEELFCFQNTSGEHDKLGSTFSMEINGQKFETNKNFMLVVPAFVPHGKIEIKNVESPAFSYITGAGREHVGLPKENWKTEDIPPIEDMYINYNGATGNPEVPKEANQEVLMKCLYKYIPSTEIVSILRRFDKSGQWLFSNGHLHDNPEALCYYGTDPWHPYEFGGEITQYIGGEKFVIAKPCVCFFAPYVFHCPLQIEKIDTPCFWHSLAPTMGAYNGKKLEGMNGEDGEDIIWPW